MIHHQNALAAKIAVDNAQGISNFYQVNLVEI